MPLQTTSAIDGRIPLGHPEMDTIHLRANALLNAGAVSGQEFRTIANTMCELRKVDRRLALRLAGQPLPPSHCRPELPDEAIMPASRYLGEPEILVLVGWVWRVDEDVRALEAKYFGGNDDI